MPQTVNFNGVAYTIPLVNETGWGTTLTAYLAALAAGAAGVNVANTFTGFQTFANGASVGTSGGQAILYFQSAANVTQFETGYDPAGSGLLYAYDDVAGAYVYQYSRATLRLMVMAAGGLAVSGPTALNTVTSGLWNGTPLTSAYVPALSALSGSLALTQLASGAAATGNVLAWNGTAWAPASAGSGSGTVTSVAATVPSALLTVSGSPITTSGTLTLTLVSAAQNAVFAGPATGGAGVPAYRALVAADVPTLPSTQISGLVASATTDTTNAANITSGTLATSRVAGSYTGITGIGTLTAGSVPVSLVSGLAASATTDTTNAANISSGTLATARIAGAYTGITSVGTLTAGAVPFTLLTGTATAAQIPATLNATTFPSTTGVKFVAGTTLSAPADGTLQVMTSAGADGTLLLGPATATGAELVASGGVLVVANGAGVSAPIQAGTFRGTSALTTLVFANANAGTYGLGFSDATHTTGYASSIVGWSLDSAANMTVPVSLGYKNLAATAAVSTTLTAAQSGAVFTFTGSTAAQTITLPAPAVGLTFTIVNASSVSVSVTTPTGTVNAAGLTAGTTRTLSTLAAGTLTCNGTNYYFTTASGVA